MALRKTVSEIFASHLIYLKGLATKRRIDLSEVLSALVSNKSALTDIVEHALTPAARTRRLIARYRVQFYEWTADMAMGDAERWFKDVAGRRKGGKQSGDARRATSLARKRRIIEKAAEMSAGVAGKKVTNKAVARALDEDPEYVRHTRAEHKKAGKAD
jgi:hypothetical protein